MIRRKDLITEQFLNLNGIMISLFKDTILYIYHGKNYMTYVTSEKVFKLRSGKMLSKEEMIEYLSAFCDMSFFDIKFRSIKTYIIYRAICSISGCFIIFRYDNEKDYWKPIHAEDIK